MTDQQDQERGELTSEQAELVIKSIEEVEHEEADGQETAESKPQQDDSDTSS